MNATEINDQFYSKIPRRWKAAYTARFVSEHFLGVKPLTSYFRNKTLKHNNKIAKLLDDFPQSLLQVDQLDAKTAPKQINKNYINKGRPFVIRGGANDWQALKEWDFEFFRNNYGDHEVILSNHKDLGNEGGEPEITDLANIIDGLNKDSKKYARFNPLLDVYPELQKSLNQEWLDKVRSTKLMKHHVLFVGNKGTKTDVHCAGNENIFVHVKGIKRWLMWDQRAHLLLNPEVNRGPAKASSYNPYQNENENMAFMKIPRYDVTCSKGDILYIPAYLWHHVYNETPTIGVGNRWLSPRNTIVNNPMYAILELFNTSPNVFTTLNLRKGFDFNKILLKSMKGQ